MIWRIKYYHVRIVVPNLSLMKANRLSTRKRDSRTSRRGAPNAGEPENHREETAASETSRGTVIPPAAGGKPQEAVTCDCSTDRISDNRCRLDLQ